MAVAAVNQPPPAEQLTLVDQVLTDITAHPGGDKGGAMLAMTRAKNAADDAIASRNGQPAWQRGANDFSRLQVSGQDVYDDPSTSSEVQEQAQPTQQMRPNEPNGQLEQALMQAGESPSEASPSPAAASPSRCPTAEGDARERCDKSFCMCLTPGEEVGYRAGQYRQPFELVAQRQQTPFLQLFLAELPGGASLQLRQMWELVTRLVSENRLFQERDSERNPRTEAFSRLCGGLVAGAASPDDSAANDNASCQRVKQSEHDDPTLVTMQVDMRRGGMQALANKGLLDATFSVFIVRNPIDQYMAYLDELEQLQPTFERMLPEVLRYEGTDAARAMLRLMGTPGQAAPPYDKFVDMVLAPAEKDAANAADAAAIARDLRDRAKATGEDYQKLAMKEAIEARELAIHESMLYSAPPPVQILGGASSGRSSGHRRLLDATSQAFKRGAVPAHFMTPLLPHTPRSDENVHDPFVRDVASKLEQAKYSEDPQRHSPLFTQLTPEMEKPVGPELGRLWSPPHTFSRFFEEQYIPYLQLALSYSLASKQRYVLRYEDMERDPTGTFFKLLATTGVAQKLGISRRVLIKVLEKRRGQPLLNLRPFGESFTVLHQSSSKQGSTAAHGASIDAYERSVLMQPQYEPLLAKFGYNCYDSVVRTTYAGAPQPTPVDLAELAVEQAKQQDAATALGEEASGHVDDMRRFARESGRVGRHGGGGGHIVMLWLVVGMLALYIVYGAPRTQPTEALAALSACVTRALGAPSTPGDEAPGTAAEEAQSKAKEKFKRAKQED